MQFKSFNPNTTGDLLMKLLASSQVRKAKKLLATATLTIGLGLGLSAPVHAQAFDPCTVYMCMAGISGEGATGGPGCAPALFFWHDVAPAGLAVYDYFGFDAPASYALREAYLSSCPGADYLSNAAIVQEILAEWGSEP
jgi:hypothetical protein